jgi:hypothetical protein
VPTAAERWLPALLIAWSAAAQAQDTVMPIEGAPAGPAVPRESGDSLPDPKRCVVLLEELTDVGFRIADAQGVAETVQRAIRKRVGRDGIVYGGVAKSQRELQKMLGQGVETPAIQQKKLDYFKAAEENATWLLRARFGVSKKGPKDKKHWITLSCRKRGADPKSPIEEKRVEAATFVDAKAALDAAMPTFCMQIPSTEQLPMEGVAPATPAEPPGLRKKVPKPWSPPPPRP